MLPVSSPELRVSSTETSKSKAFNIRCESEHFIALQTNSRFLALKSSFGMTRVRLIPLEPGLSPRDQWHGGQRRQQTYELPAAEVFFENEAGK